MGCAQAARNGGEYQAPALAPFDKLLHAPAHPGARIMPARHIREPLITILPAVPLAVRINHASSFARSNANRNAGAPAYRAINSSLSSVSKQSEKVISAGASSRR